MRIVHLTNPVLKTKGGSNPYPSLGDSQKILEANSPRREYNRLSGSHGLLWLLGSRANQGPYWFGYPVGASHFGAIGYDWIWLTSPPQTKPKVIGSARSTSAPSNATNGPSVNCLASVKRRMAKISISSWC